MTASVLGYSAVTSIGATSEATYRELCEGRSGLGPLRGFRPEQFAGRHAYQIDDGKQNGRSEPGRATRLLGDAIRQACDDAGVEPGDAPIIVGTGLAELRTLELAACAGRVPSSGEIDIGRAISKQLSAPDVTTVVNACSASLHALALALDLLELGETEEVVVAGVDVLTASMHGLLDRVQPVVPDVVRPFDSGPKGVIMGEGAAALVLSSRSSGAAPQVRSVGMNCDAGHVTMPDRNGMVDAMRMAHRMAQVGPSDIDLVMLHGTGTPQNDSAEGSAMCEVFGKSVSRPASLAIKSRTGHTSGASGLVAAAMAIEAMRKGAVPPNQPLRQVIPEARELTLDVQVVDRIVNNVQINAFGFGGVNAVAIIGSGKQS